MHEADGPTIRPGSAATPEVSICIPHYQVGPLMQLCLRAIRRYTDGPPYEVIVVDNGSADGSLDWLRSIPWIRLVERGSATPSNWVYAMNTALDVGLGLARGRYYCIMHSDVVVKHEGWLSQLVDAIAADPTVAAAGSGKLEDRSRLGQRVKDLTDTKRLRRWLRRRVLGDATARELPREPCPRDYCAVYRTDVLRSLGLSFVARGGYSAGETVYFDLKAAGYRAAMLPVDRMAAAMDHVAHASGAILPDRHLKHRRTERKTRRRLKRLFGRSDVAVLLEDEALER